MLTLFFVFFFWFIFWWYIFLVVFFVFMFVFHSFYRRDEYEVTDNGLTQTITEKAQELMMEAMQTSGEKVKIKSSM